MPKIPTYKEQVGLASGSLGPRASVSSFTQAAKGYQAMGKAIQGAAEIASKFEIARQESDASDYLRVKQREAHDKVLELSRNPEINSFDKYMDAYKQVEDGVFSEIDAAEKLNSRQKKGIKDKLFTSMGGLRVTGAKNAFAIEQGIKSDNFNEEGQSLLERVRVGAITIEAAAADYEEKYNIGNANGLSISLNPEQFNFELMKDEASFMIANPELTIQDLEKKLIEVENAQGFSSQLESGERASVANIIETGIQERSVEYVTRGNGLVTSGVTGLKYASTQEEITNAQTQAQQGISLLNEAGETALAEQAQLNLNVGVELLGARSELAFADREDLAAAISASNEVARDAIGTDSLMLADAYARGLRELIMANEERKALDPAKYVVDEFTRIYGKPPTVEHVYQKQIDMGIDEESVKILTGGKVAEIMDSVNNAQTATEAREILTNMDAGPYTPLAISQLREEGLTLTQMFAAKNPDSPIAQKLFMSLKSPAVIGDQKPPTAWRNSALAVVRGDTTMDAHLKSMGFMKMAGIGDEDLMFAGVDTADTSMAREEILAAITDFAVSLAYEDGKTFTGDSRIEPSDISKYAKQAVRVLSSVYDYPEVNGHPLRIKKEMEGASKEISQGIDYFVKTITEDEIFYESPNGFEEGSPEYEIERLDYLENIQKRYKAITRNGDTSAIVTDEYGGAVRVKRRTGVPSDPSGFTNEPLILNFAESVTLIQREGVPKLRRLSVQSKELATQLKNMKPSEKRTPEGKRKIESLTAKIERLERQQQDLRSYLRDIGVITNVSRVTLN